MPYARYGSDSDVYIYASGSNKGDIWMVHVKGDTSYQVTSLEELKAKCNFLKKSGYRVPERVCDRIAREISERGTE